MWVRIKICGFTHLADAQVAVSLGVDALGFVFVKQSARYIAVDHAQPIIEQLPPFVHVVGLFMDQTRDEVLEIIRRLHLSSLQFHGSESPDFCAAFAMPYTKAIPMGSDINVLKYTSEYGSASGFLFDSHGQGALGGQGKGFDWAMIPQNFNKPVILAGGLTPENVAIAIQQVQPYAVDVSSGVEQIKGKKHADKMRTFVQNVRNSRRSDM